MRKNSEEKPIDIISMEEYLKKRQVVRQPETVWEGWREKSASILPERTVITVELFPLRLNRMFSPHRNS